MARRLTAAQKRVLLGLLKDKLCPGGLVTVGSLLRRGLVEFAPIGVDLTPAGRLRATRLAAKGGA